VQNMEFENELELLKKENKQLKKIIEQAIKITKLEHYHISENGDGFLGSFRTSLIEREDCEELFDYVKGL